MKKYKLINRKLFFLLALVAGGFLLLASPEKEYVADNGSGQKQKDANPSDNLKFGFITDAHCYAKNGKNKDEWELNWRCSKPLSDFVWKMNNDYHPDFVLENGDFIDGKDDRSYADFLDAKKIFDQVSAPNFHVMGNHEARSFHKDQWLELIGREKPYYYFDAKGYRIIVLNGNNKRLVDGSIVNASPQIESYPGLLDVEQIDWLNNLMNDSKDYPKIVFVHQPPIYTDAKTQPELFIDGGKLRKVFAQNNVRAVFSGHVERACNFIEDGVEYYVLPGFWKSNTGLKEDARYKDKGVFSEVEVTPEKVAVKMYFLSENEPEKEDKFIEFQESQLGLDERGFYSSADITPEKFNCHDGSTLLK